MQERGMQQKHKWYMGTPVKAKERGGYLSSNTHASISQPILLQLILTETKLMSAHVLQCGCLITSWNQNCCGENWYFGVQSNTVKMTEPHPSYPYMTRYLSLNSIMLNIYASSQYQSVHQCDLMVTFRYWVWTMLGTSREAMLLQTNFDLRDAPTSKCLATKGDHLAQNPTAGAGSKHVTWIRSWL